VLKLYANNIDMKQILKQSVIGGLYLFSIASFGAVVVIIFYALAGK
jgi:hypothetical protein